jgi:leader peptidase (prepilin peptidase)/N-methyltransferase
VITPLGIEILVGLLGLIIGSFLSVCVYRIPLGRFDGPEYDIVSDETAPEYAPETYQGTPITFSYPQRSLSPCCKQQLKWWHNIPVVSWLLLNGRCGFCKTPIPMRYPLVELASGAAAMLSMSHYGLTATGILIYVFCCVLIVVTVIDYDYFIIPDLITYPGIIIGGLVAVLNQYMHLFEEPVADGIMWSALGVLAGGGFLYVVSELYFRLRHVDGLGLGDVKLLIMTGALFGPGAALFTIFFGSLVGSLSGGLLLLIGGRSMSQHLPFGPSLAIATGAYLFFRQPIGELLGIPL